MAHGEVTVAMVVSFRLFFEGPTADIAYSVVLASMTGRLLAVSLVFSSSARWQRSRGAALPPSSC